MSAGRFKKPANWNTKPSAAPAILNKASNPLDSMSEKTCEACGTELTKHFGLYGTCAQKCAWEYLAKKLANALYQVDDPTLADEVLAEYERFRFLETYPK
jgi:hypothetical protein